MRCQKFDFQITWWIEWISTHQTAWATWGTYDDRNAVYRNDYKKWNESENKETARLLMKDIMKVNTNKQAEEDTWCVGIKPKRISYACKNNLRAGYSNPALFNRCINFGRSWRIKSDMN